MLCVQLLPLSPLFCCIRVTTRLHAERSPSSNKSERGTPCMPPVSPPATNSINQKRLPLSSSRRHTELNPGTKFSGVERLEKQPSAFSDSKPVSPSARGKSEQKEGAKAPSLAAPAARTRGSVRRPRHTENGAG